MAYEADLTPADTTRAQPAPPTQNALTSNTTPPPSTPARWTFDRLANTAILIGLPVGGAYLGYRATRGLGGMAIGAGIGCAAVALYAIATLGSVRY